MGEYLRDYAPWVISLLTIIGTFIYNSRKVQVDESAIVLAEWKKLLDAHQHQIGTLNAEISGLRERLTLNEREFAEYRRATEKRIRDLEEENAGLKRAIAQNSQSAVFAIGKVERASKSNKRGLSDLTDRFDDVGGNSDGRPKEDGE